MNENANIFLGKKILIYGLGKSGVSSCEFLRKKNKIFLFDDNKNVNLKNHFKDYKVTLNKVKTLKFDVIILSPGIDINKCKLNKFLRKNYKIIYTDLDIFSSFYKNQCITVTGTNGKSTTCQLLYQVFKKQKIDVRLVGNIGYPILSLKNIKKKTIFVIEASSYQLEYSKLFKTNYAVILNIAPDHLERHKTIYKYISAKFKLIKNQDKNSIAFINKYDKHIKNRIKKSNFNSKIIKVNTKLDYKKVIIYHNEYFSSVTNRENLSFVIEVAKRFNIKKSNLIDVIKRFKGLSFRQQIILKKNNIIVINDSKSTSYSSSIEMLNNDNSIYWMLGGIAKKGDKFFLQKKNFNNIKGYLFGKYQKKFLSDLKYKINLKKFHNMKDAMIELLRDIKKDVSPKKIILFSPAAASFDSFKNFEDRGHYFNKLIKENIINV